MFGVNNTGLRQRAVHLAFYPATSAVKATIDVRNLAKATAFDIGIERRRSAAALGVYDILRRAEFKEYVRERELEIGAVEAEYLETVLKHAPHLLPAVFAVSTEGVAVPA